MNYNDYNEQVLEKLTEAVNKTWEDGIWRGNGKQHILPLKNNENNQRNKIESIKKYLGFDCKRCLPERQNGLHQYAHHLNSSQLLCMMFFVELIDEKGQATDKMVRFIKTAFGIDIHKGAKCDFEYIEDIERYKFQVAGMTRYEGTTFDFHIKDSDTEIYFEIKFTEPGFGKTEKDDIHKEKAPQYLELLKEFYDGQVTDVDILNHYQLFRNVIRANNKDKYVVFITDGDNPETKKDIEEFKQLFSCPNNVIFTTWQDIMDAYPCELPFQLRAIKK